MAKLDINLSVNGTDKAIKLKEQITSLEKANNDLRGSSIAYQKTINSLRKDEDNYAKVKQKLTDKIKKHSLSIKENNVAITEAKNSLKSLKTYSDNAGNGMANLAKNVLIAYAAYKTLQNAMQLVISNGFSYNKTMEESNAGLIALSVAIQDKSIPVMERYNLASKEAAAAQVELQKINKETPHTLDQTVQIYKAMYVSMKNVGASSMDIINLTKKLSIASGAAGINFQALLAGVDGLASGTVLANSDLGRFLRSIGLTNEALKNSKDVVALLNDKLKDFKAADTMEVALSNIENSWNVLTGKMTEDSFQGVKKGLNELSKLLNSLSDNDIKNLRTSFNSFTTGIINSIYAISYAVLKLDNGFQTLGAGIADITFNISKFKKSLESSFTPNIFLHIYSLFKDIKDGAASLDDADKKAKNSMYIKTNNIIDTNNRLINTLKEAKDATIETIYKNEKLNKTNIDSSILEEKRKKAIEATTTQLKLLSKAQALIDPTQPIIDKYNAMYEAIQAAPKGMFDETDMTKFFTSWQSAIDAVMKKQEQMTKLERDWSKEKQKINDDISLSNLNGYDKQLQALENWRDSELEKYSSIADAKAKIEEGFNSKLIKLNEEAAQNALKTMTSMYSDVNSLLSDLFDANDARAKKMAEVNKALHTAQMIMHLAEMAQSTAFTSLFVANEATKSTAAGTTAVAVAAQSSPWTGMATAAAMAAMLSSLGIALGAFEGNDTVSYTYDKFSAQKANSGTGTTLGDSTQASKSITDSLKLMSDLAKPEYRLFTQMNNSLMSIDQKIAGVSTLLLQQGGFAMGEGANIAGLKTTPNLISKIQGATIGSLALGSGLSNIGVDIISTALKSVIGDNFVSNIFSGITGAIGNAVSSIFGGGTSTSQTLYDYGITFNKQLINGAIDSINGSAYQTIQTRVKKSGGLFSSGSTSYYYNSYFKAIDDSIKNQFQLILGNLYDTVVQSGQGLDTETQNIINTLDTFTVNLGKISFKGLSGQQIQDKLTAVFGKVGDQLAQTVFPELMPFQQVGEALYSTMIRVSSGVEQANYYISMLGKSFSDVKYTDIINKQGDVALEALRQSIVALDSATYGANNGVIQLIYGVNTTASDLYDMYKTLNTMRLQIESTGQSMSNLTSSMILGAGGISQLSDGLDAYYKNFLTSEEQVTLKTKEMLSSFDALGIAMPTSNEQFKNLVQSIDTSTVSGQQLYGQVIALSGSFSDLTSQVKDTVNNLNNTIISTIDSITSSFNKIVTNSTVTLDKFRTSLNNALSLAGGTDRQALASALQVVQSQAGALTNAANFSTLFDMQFAQATATNRLNEVKQGALSQIDYLSNIANLLNGTLNVNVVSMSSTPIVNTKITPFANGGIVTKPTNALIGEAGYNEAVIPLKNPNDPLGQDKLQSQIYDLQQQQKESNGFMFTIAHEVIELNKLMRRITNGGDKMLVELGA